MGNKTNQSEEKERGRFEGMVIQKLDGLDQKMDEQRKDLKIFKADIYEKVGENTQDIARQKGWMAGIALVAGTAGGFIKGFIFRQ